MSGRLSHRLLRFLKNCDVSIDLENDFAIGPCDPLLPAENRHLGAAFVDMADPPFPFAFTANLIFDLLQGHRLASF